jgi:hypothetical protein
MTDILLHALAGAALAMISVGAGAPVLGIFFALLFGYERERVQLMVRDIPFHTSHFRFWRWDAHHLIEWAAWPLGASVAVCGWRVFG